MNALLKTARIPGRQRHSLIAPPPDRAMLLKRSVQMSVDQLRGHFRTAVELEHSTLPPYLSALYSMQPGSNTFAYSVLQSVAMEEMLHMVQALNILTAIGGTPAVNTPDFIPEYPTYLPNSDKSFLVPLQKFSKDTINVFLKIELPATKAAPPEPNHYHTIGQFYAALKDEIIAHGDAIFTGNPKWQITPDHYYGAGGRLIPVYCAKDAVEGIDQIVGQGEGIDGKLIDTDHVLFGEEIEYAHYFRYNEVLCERRYLPHDDPKKPPTGPKVEVDWNAVLNFRANPKLSHYPAGSPLWKLTLDFNKAYMQLLNAIQIAASGNPGYLVEAIPLMYQLKYKATELMNIPLDSKSQETAGPSFEYTPI